MRCGQGEHGRIYNLGRLTVVILILMQGSLAAAECYVDHELNLALSKPVHTSPASVPGSFTTNGIRAEFGKYCMNTAVQENPWLVVDLQETVPVSTVILTAITSYLDTAWYQILVGDTFDAATFDPLTSGYEPCLPRNVSMREFEVLHVHCERTLVGRYVLVFKQESSTLRVCHVEVYTEQVFQPEKWTCIRPELQGPSGLLNLARLKNATQLSTSYQGYAWKAVDGNDNPAMGSQSCMHNDPPSSAYSWWRVDLGMSFAVTGVAITNRNDGGLGHHLTNFKILVGNVGPSSTLVESDYEVAAHMCVTQTPGRKYYKVDPPIEGNHVAITITNYHMVCEVEVYSDDLNDITLSSWTNNITHSHQMLLYDDNDTTCINLPKDFGLNPINIEILWDPTARTGVAERTANYFCKQDFYVNVTHTVGIELAVSVSQEQVIQTATGAWSYQGKYCEVIGETDDDGLRRSRYACFCEVKCWVFIRAKDGKNVANSRLCTINVYD